MTYKTQFNRTSPSASKRGLLTQGHVSLPAVRRVFNYSGGNSHETKGTNQRNKSTYLHLAPGRLLWSTPSRVPGGRRVHQGALERPGPGRRELGVPPPCSRMQRLHGPVKVLSVFKCCVGKSTGNPGNISHNLRTLTLEPQTTRKPSACERRSALTPTPTHK